MPRLSVIVPVYSAEKYITKCLDSILSQTFTDFELLLVDDGSSDRCGEICDQYAKMDKRIKVFHKDNGGVSNARNLGLSKADGAYIAFVDPDDYIDKDMFKDTITYLQKTDGDIVCFEVCEVKKSRNKIGYHFDENKIMTGREALNFILEDVIDNSPCNKIYKKEVWHNVSFPHGRRYEDVATIYRTFAQAAKVVYFKKALYYYIKHEGSATAVNFDFQRRYECFTGYKERLDFALKKNLDAVMACRKLAVETALATLTAFYAKESDGYLQKAGEIKKFISENIRELQNVRLKTKHRFLLFSFVHCPSLHKIYAKLSALSKKVK